MWKLILLSGLITAGLTIGYQIQHPAYTCVDGDTFALGKVYYRLAWVDTPEKGQARYEVASQFTCDFLHNNKNIYLIPYGADKYNRILVDVLDGYGQNLNEDLARLCLAEPFYISTTQNVRDLYAKCAK